MTSMNRNKKIHFSPMSALANTFSNAGTAMHYQKESSKVKYKLFSIDLCPEKYFFAYKLWPMNLEQLKLFAGNNLSPHNPHETFEDSIGMCTAEDRFRML